jgi:hypothetical protein
MALKTKRFHGFMLRVHNASSFWTTPELAKKEIGQEEA